MQIRGILSRYPWLCNRTIYIAGESYAGHFTIQLATVMLREEFKDLCVELGGVMAGNAVVDINQTNYAWFENGYTHSLIDGSTWDGIRQHCDFAKDLGIDGNGCPSEQTPECSALISRWMNISGADSGRLSLYDYYADQCSRTSDNGSIGTPCSDDLVSQYLNRPAVRKALHVSPHAAPEWAPCSDVWEPHQ